MDLSKLLNPQQLEAVQATEGPVLILAGAGSGKTRVITYRVVHLVEGIGVRPDSILAVTFTNKAADQMKFRVRNLLQGSRSGDPLISTFHSFCVRMLRRGGRSTADSCGVAFCRATPGKREHRGAAADAASTS